MGLGILLYLGIGDTLRVSLTADPVLEVQAAYHILRAMGLRRRGVEIISCPLCGRAEMDLSPVVRQVEASVSGWTEPIQVAIMGCPVNGPGEAREADVGIAGGKGRGSSFPQGQGAPEGQGRRDGLGPAERGGSNQKKILRGNLMRFSRKLLQTYREDPADAEAISHKLMVRAGMVRQLAAGLYIYLPLGLRVLNKVNAIIREEMNAIGGQEISMPILHPAEIWQQIGRWYDIGDEMFRLKDRTHRDMVLGMTHEEVVAWLAAREIRSYRDLPQIWYQIQTKLRDEARPKGGVLRTREFFMKDSYSLDLDADGLEKKLSAALRGLLQDLRTMRREVLRGGKRPGDDGRSRRPRIHGPQRGGGGRSRPVRELRVCRQRGAGRVLPAAPSFPSWKLEEVATPDSRTIEEVSAFLGIDPRLTIKSLLLMAERRAGHGAGPGRPAAP